MRIKIRIKSSLAVTALAAAEGVSESAPVASLRVIFRRVVRTVSAAAALAACANSTASLPPTLLKPPDPRISRLERFFRRNNCPAPQFVSEYLRAADRFGLDYRLLPALSVRETGCGRTQVHNNRWGYHTGRQAFSSIEAGIQFVAQVLAEKSPYKGKSLHQKLFTYNPRPAYPGEVTSLMHQIE